MEFLKVLKNRVSVRAYNGKEISKADIRKVLECMQLAPTAKHFESYKVRVAYGNEEVIKISGAVKGQEDRFKGASCVMVFFAEVSGQVVEVFGNKGKELFSIQDATLACAYAQLSATDLGISSLWVGAFDEAVLRKLCEVGDELKPTSVLVLGYSDAKSERASRKPLDKLLF